MSDLIFRFKQVLDREYLSTRNIDEIKEAFDRWDGESALEVGGRPIDENTVYQYLIDNGVDVVL